MLSIPSSHRKEKEKKNRNLAKSSTETNEVHFRDHWYIRPLMWTKLGNHKAWQFSVKFVPWLLTN